MDELLQHCLRELAFDGDLGRNVSRLRDFVCEFYTNHVSMHQTLDDFYHAFVWSLIAQQPSVRVGMVPLGQSSEVYIPPQPRAGKKSKAAQDNGQQNSLTAVRLELIPESSASSLDELFRMYGERLRIAVDPETCFVAITGSHAKPAKLTPMVYATLQLISRSREAGISVLDLGRTTGYDQKTCFYLVKQLLDLDLVVKLRRGGTSQNFCVHKYFFDRSPTWKKIREEELRVQEESTERETSAVTTAAGDNRTPDPLYFDPIDTRHLSSLNILRQRLVKLLKHSANETQQYTNIAIRIGFRPRSRTDRRFFITRLKELINEGTVEKIFVTSTNPDTTKNRQLCLRLVSPEKIGESRVDDLVKVSNDEGKDEDMTEDLLAEDSADNGVHVKATITLHKQIVNLIEGSSTTGITLNELSDRLGSFDKRTLELLISRMERQAPPPHLADLSVIQVLEFHGRERRYRFFTLSGYSGLMAREGFEEPSGRYNSRDVAGAKGFLEVCEADFYETPDQLLLYLSKWGGKSTGRPRKPRDTTTDGGNARKKPRTSQGLTEEDGKVNTTPRKKKEWVNPILPDGTRKRGRPVKDPEIAEKRRQRRRKNEETGADANGAASVVCEADPHKDIKRKRSADDRQESEAEVVVGEFEAGADADDQDQFRPGMAQDPPKRKRGRPAKKKKKIADDEYNQISKTNPLEAGSIVATEEVFTVISPDNASAKMKKRPSKLGEKGAKSDKAPTADSLAVDLPLPDASGSQLSSSMHKSMSSQTVSFLPRPHSTMSPEANILPTDNLKGLAAFQHAENIGPEEVTRVIASLAAQVNESLAASTESNGTQEELFPHFHFQEGFDDTILPNDRLRDQHDNSYRFGGNTTEVLEDSCQASTSKRADIDSKNVGIHDDFVENSSVVAVPDADSQNSVMVSATPKAPSEMKLARVRKGISARFSGKTNISAIRRENEFVQLMERAGGIMFMDFIEDTVKKGEIASAPVGAKMDRRTLNYSLDNLEFSGRIKIVTTNISSIMGGSRTAKIAYLPIVGEEQLRASLVAVPHRHEQIELDPNSPRALADHYHERWHKNPSRAQKLFGYSDDQTLSQTYGYLPGKVARARELHLRTTQYFESARIVNWAFFENDVSLATYCACVASLGALTTEDGRGKLVKDIPSEWRHALHIGKARSRDRIFDLLEYLRSLKVVTPLQESTSDTALIRCSQKGYHPTAFKAMPSDWASKVPLVHPKYWRFNNSAPIYLFALQNDPPPFYTDMLISTQSDIVAFWEELKSCCLDREHAEYAQKLANVESSHGPYAVDQRIATALRRSVSWTSDYTLSWYQTQYLKRFINHDTAMTPLQDADSGADSISRICHVSSAPFEVVRRFFQTSHESALKDLEKALRVQAQQSMAKQQIEMKALLTQKGKEAVKSREHSWDAMVEKVHPELLKGVAAARLRKLRQSFILGNTVQDNHQWELQIDEAIKSAEKFRVSRNLFPSVSASRHVNPQQRSIVTHNRPVQLLISMQKDGSNEPEEIELDSEVRKPRKGRMRRHRFQWTHEFDELARDAAVIIRARCRTHHRLEWAALDQIFPSVPRNSVRARISTLKAQTGAEAYLLRLENCWHELWVKNRGIPELPDENPRNPIEFDLKAHLEFLRKHIDKNAIRVGISNDKEETHFIIPADPIELSQSWDMVERGPAHANLEFLLNNVLGEEAREKLFLESALVMENESAAKEAFLDYIAFAESALKMVVGTPIETYDASFAATLLHGVGEKEITTAMDNLLSRNVLSKLLRDPNRLVPGRTVKISEMNQNALGGSLSGDFFQDASQLEESYSIEQAEWREWPLVSTDGDTAALLQQISDHKVEFEVNTSHAQATRALVDGNSRKADDNDIELGIRIRFSNTSLPPKDAVSTQVISLTQFETGTDSYGHGLTVSGGGACVVDCFKCIEASQVQLDNWTDKDRRIASSIIQLADGRATLGIKIEELRTILMSECSVELCMDVIYRLSTLHVPIIYLTGYSSSLVVSAKFVSTWAVTLPGTTRPITKLFPRRWLDIAGGRVTEVWNAALRAVVGLVHLKPGISQSELRWRLRAVYDRQEINDVINHLTSNGTLKHSLDADINGEVFVCLDALSEQEEKAVRWFIREGKHWYQVL
ncbi:hypothetical protein DFH11DRAFT_1685786 [Phellopilus nigrolimitatus]|nr:hypothetical protein DFH11DRAFT_1685786 [Phellopilus nigrolimitatus]